MSKPLLSLCYVPNVAMRDGYSGGNAKILLPFYGYWFASGQQYTWPTATIGQDLSRRVGGINSPDVFQKDCCCCGIHG